jgi:hypothetical protein
MQLTESQQQAREWFFQLEGTGTLIGAAGSGKTFLVATLIDDILDKDPDALIGVSAPTNKAVRVLEEKLSQFNINKLVGKPQYKTIALGTIHKFLKSIPTEEEEDDSELEFTSDPVETRPYGLYDYVFVDEASMINNLLFEMIMESIKGKLLFIGDPYQLYPVKENRVSAPFRQIKKVFYLEGIVRYQGNILKTASRIRERIENEEIDYAYVFPKSVESITVCKEKVAPENSHWFADFLHMALQEANFMGNPRPDYLRMLVYKRRTLETFSTLIRTAVYGETALFQYVPGECLFSHQPFHAYYSLTKHLELFDLSWVSRRTEEQTNKTKYLVDERDKARKRLANSEDFYVKSCEIKEHYFFSPLTRSNNHAEFLKYFQYWEPQICIEYCLLTLTYKGREYEVAVLTDSQRKAYARFMQYVLDFWKQYRIPEPILVKYKSLLNNTFNTQFEFQHWTAESDKPYCFEDGNKTYKVTNKLYSSWVITVHKSQGTTLNKVFYNYADCFSRNPNLTPYENNSVIYRLLYTAITRASEDLWVFTRR